MVPRRPRAYHLPMVGREWACLFGAALCFGLAWLNLGAHRWQLGMSLIPFGAVLVVVTVAMYRDRKRNA